MINLWWRMICRNKRLYKWFIFVPTRRIRIGSAAGRIIFFFLLANTQISLRDSRNMVGSSTERALLILQTYSHASSCICEQRALLIIFASVKNWIFNIAILRKHCTLPTPYICIETSNDCMCMLCVAYICAVSSKLWLLPALVWNRLYRFMYFWDLQISKKHSLRVNPSKIIENLRKRFKKILR